MRIAWSCFAVLMAAVFLATSPVQAQTAKSSPLAGWWGYDENCPASDDGFGLEQDGRASGGSDAYDGRWSLRKDQLTIVWAATKSGRPHIERSQWRIVENFKLVREPQRRAMLVNIKNSQRAWLCRTYR